MPLDSECSSGMADPTFSYFVSGSLPRGFRSFWLVSFIARVFLMSSGRELVPFCRPDAGCGHCANVTSAIYGPHAPWPLLGGGLFSAWLSSTHSGPRLWSRLLGCSPESSRAQVVGSASFALYGASAASPSRERRLPFLIGQRNWPIFLEILVLMFVIAQAAAFLICYGYDSDPELVDDSPGTAWAMVTQSIHRRLTAILRDARQEAVANSLLSSTRAAHCQRSQRSETKYASNTRC